MQRGNKMTLLSGMFVNRRLQNKIGFDDKMRIIVIGQKNTVVINTNQYLF